MWLDDSSKGLIDIYTFSHISARDSILFYFSIFTI